jgi:DNA-binding transcriptional regulator PaaX
MEQTWLVFIPQLPSSPSSLRVLVWRRMRTAGAAALQQGVWVLPQTPEHEQLLRDVLREAQQQGGSGILLVATPLDADRASEVVERFRADRDEEYREFGVQCRDFLAEIAKETDARNLTFAALEENEHDLQKLHTWLGKIHARDFCGALQAHAAAEALTACERALHGFAEAIYAREGLQGHAEDERGN